MKRVAAIVCLLSWFSYTSWAAGQEVRPAVKSDESLTRLVDPSGDDWVTEVQGDRAKHRLGEIAALLTKYGGLNPTAATAAWEYFSPALQVPHFWTLRSVGIESTVGGFSLDRAQNMGGVVVGQAPKPWDVFDHLMEPHRGGQDLRLELKVVGVEGIDDKSFSTRVIFHAYSTRPSSRVQQNAKWVVKWVIADNPDKPLIDDITVRDYEEISTPAAAFIDCTRGVIKNDTTWSPTLAHGCEYWNGRIDALGETNLMGHNGIAVGDVNGDGLDDLYVAMGTGLPNKLLVQQPDGSVKDMAAEAGVDWLDDTKGVLLIDYDNDGDQDLVLAMGPTILFMVNDGKGHFTPAGAARAHTDGAFYSLCAADYDGDSDLDIYGSRYVEVQYGVSIPFPFQDANNGPPNILLRNDGPKGFTDVTREVGLDVNNRRFSTAASWCDYDNDGDPDLYVSNDFGRNNLYRNDGGKFVDVAAQAGVEDQAAGMGVAWADIDNDGNFDLYVSNMYSSAGNRIAYQSRFQTGADAVTRAGVQRLSQGNSLFVNQGDGTFRDKSDDAGVRMGRWAWGAKFVDINNDGYEDIVCPNGFLTGGREEDL